MSSFLNGPFSAQQPVGSSEPQFSARRRNPLVLGKSREVFQLADVKVQDYLSDDNIRRSRTVMPVFKPAHDRGSPVHDVALRLAERVRQMRQKCDLTQASLASRAGITVETVARLERVVRGRDSANFNPSLDTLLRLSAALGVDVCDLLATKAPPKQRDDRMTVLLRRASPATAQRIFRVAEVLLSDDAAGDAATRRHGRRARR